MITIKGKGIVPGRARAPVLVSRSPINFVAAHTKPLNALFPSWFLDPHHELYRKDLQGTIVAFPSCIGSTWTGIVIPRLMRRKNSPAGFVVRQTDPLLVAGLVLSAVWYHRTIPVVQCEDDDLLEKISGHGPVEIDGDTGEIFVEV